MLRSSRADVGLCADTRPAPLFHSCVRLDPATYPQRYMDTGQGRSCADRPSRPRCPVRWSHYQPALEQRIENKGAAMASFVLCPLFFVLLTAPILEEAATAEQQVAGAGEDAEGRLDLPAP